MVRIFQFKMPGFLKATLSVANAQALLARFQPVSINEVKAPDAKFPRLYRVRAAISYVAQPTEKIKYSKPTKSMGQGLRRVEVEKYHRYIVFGLPNSSVIGMFTTNSRAIKMSAPICCCFETWISSRDYPTQHRGSNVYRKHDSNNNTGAFSSHFVSGCAKQDNASRLRCRRQQP